MGHAIDQQRLAARYHQRQVRLVADGTRMARRIGRFYRDLPSRLGRAAWDAGFLGLPWLGRLIDDELAEIRRALRMELGEIGQRGAREARDAILAALPRDWLPVLLSMAVERGTGRVPEAATAASYPSPGWTTYEFEPIARRDVSRSEALRMIRDMLFPSPSAEDVDRWLTRAVPGGMSWDDRLRRWEAPARDGMLSELTMGLAQRDDVDALRQRLRPYADGIAWKAQRIARTEGNRVAERANRATIDGLGGLVDGLQLVAVMDEWTRPEHAARNGRIYRQGEDGAYRNERGEPLPDLPDAPNCRCMTIPVMRMPAAFRRDPALRATFTTATDRLIPDPASYVDWWQRASAQERMTAVGVRRYQAVRDLLGRPPEWTDFLDRDGSLLSVQRLKREKPAARQERRLEVRAMLDARKRMFQAVASRGYSLGSRHARPEATAVAWSLKGGVPHPQILDAMEMGDPRRIVIPEGNRQEVDDRLREILGRPLSDVQLARLAGALDRADVELQLESGGLKMKMHRGGVRAMRWIGYDDAGVMKLELIRMDVPAEQQRQGLATRSLARTIQQASSLGIQYADASASSRQGMTGYYSLARQGFTGALHPDWLEAHREELAKLGIQPASLGDLMRTAEGREFWRVYGETINVTMDLRPGSPQMLEFARYVSQRRREGRTMAESRRDDPEAYDARMRDLIPGYYPPQYPMIDIQHGIEWTEEDEEIMDRIHAEHPRTEEDRQRELEFLSRIRPGTRAPLPEAARRRLDAAKRGEHGSRPEVEETDQGPAAD